MLDCPQNPNLVLYRFLDGCSKRELNEGEEQTRKLIEKFQVLI